MYRRSKRRRPGPFIAVALVVVAGSVLAWKLQWLPVGDAPLTSGESRSTTLSAQDAENSALDRMTAALESVVAMPEAETRQVPDIERPTPEQEVTKPVAEESQAVAAATAEPRIPNSTAEPTGSNLLVQTALTLAGDDPVRARTLLTRALEREDLDTAARDQARVALRDINDTLVFSPALVPDDPFVIRHTVRSGDTLSGIRQDYGVLIEHDFIQRVNDVSQPHKIRVGDRLKLIKGPFHAVIHKDEYRLDVYLGEDSDRVFVRSFPVGLGKHDRTPVGRFRVRPKSKLTNPQWRHPETGELFLANDPENPIGEHWLGLEGLDEANRNFEGYGIHGTIDPGSIGNDESLGCVRMLPEDVAIVWETLVYDASVIEITD